MQGRAGGEDVIDDDITYGGVDGHSVSDAERAGDVLTALLAAETRLREGLMLFSEEEFRPAAGDMFRQDAGDAFRLIISAIKLPGGVQGDWHEYRPSQVAAEDFVREGGVGKVVGQERATFVFDTMDDPAGGSAGPEGADRPGEGRLKIEAMGAGSVAFEDAFEGMATG